MRRALTEWDWSTALRLFACETGASQTAIAAATGLSQPHVSRLMNGKSREPGVGTVRALCDGLGIPRALAGLAPTVPEDEEDATDRRSFLTGTAGAALLSTAPASDTRAVHIGAEEVQQLEATARELRALDRSHGGDALCEVSVRCLRRADDWLNFARYATDVGRDLQVAFGRLAQVAGWLHYDAGRQRAARMYYHEALAAAQLARDVELEVLVLSTMSMQALQLGRPREAVQLAQRAQERAAGWGTPRVKSLLLVREANGWARAGDAGSAHRTLNEADNTFDPRPYADDPYWISFFDEAELTGLRAANRSYLRRHDRAVALLEVAVQRQTGDALRRNHTWFRVALAEQRLMRGDADGACEAIADALPVFSEVTSTRTRRRLHRVCTGLARSRRRHVRDVVDQARRVGVAAV